MPKRYNIRWTNDDEAELKRVVKNFNEKLRRVGKKEEALAKQDPSYKKTTLPEKVSVKQMKKLISTRADLKRELNSLKRFSQKGAEIGVDAPGNKYNLQITKWQKEDMSRRVGNINRVRNNRLKALEDIEMTSAGENLGYTVGQFGTGTTDKNSLKPTKAFTRDMNSADVTKKHRALIKESQSNFFAKKDEELKRNYIEKGLKRNFNEEEVSDVIESIENMSFSEFYKKFKAEGGSMEWLYPPSEAERQGHIEHLKSTWTPKK